MVGLVRPPRCAKSKTAAIRRGFADTLSQLTLQQFVCLVLCLIFINVHMATTLLVLSMRSLLVGTSLLQEIVYLVSQGADPDEIGLMNIDEQLPVLEYPQPGLDIIQVT